MPVVTNKDFTLSQRLVIQTLLYAAQCRIYSELARPKTVLVPVDLDTVMLAFFTVKTVVNRER